MSGRRGPRPTSERVRRLLIMLPWLMERGEVPIAEVAQRFDVSEAEVVKDLELAAMCGLPPYQDELVDVFIDDDMVITGIPRLFTRPLRLNAPEGFALLASSGAARELPGVDMEGALVRALDKLSKVLGPSPVVVDVPAPEFADALTRSAERSERVRFEYVKAFAETPEVREVTARRVFFDRGNWYLVADDHSRSGEQRNFRIDRMVSLEALGVFDTARDVAIPELDMWFAGADLPHVVLDLAEGGTWVVERYPVVNATETDTGWRVELVVAHEEWLGELLLRLGSDATVVAPAEWRDLGQRTASRVLARYTDGS